MTSIQMSSSESTDRTQQEARYIKDLRYKDDNAAFYKSRVDTIKCSSYLYAILYAVQG
jgi:hypothetical protein